MFSEINETLYVMCINVVIYTLLFPAIGDLVYVPREINIVRNTEV